jgi:hypothetical protein
MYFFWEATAVCTWAPNQRLRRANGKAAIGMSRGVPFPEVQIAGPFRTLALGSGQDPPNLLPEHFFDLPDLFFNFAGVVFGFAFSL